MSQGHRDVVRASFTQQAAAFEDVRMIGGLVTEAEWIFQRLELSPQLLALDVAAGTGHAARGLAPHVASVIALDATAAMLEAGRIAAVASGLRNVVFMSGDASALPFADASFDVVICRFAAHHFQAPEQPFAEMLRCLRPGGQVLVADLVVADDPAVAAAQNRLERQRDPSHARCLSAVGLVEALETLGAVQVQVDVHHTVRPIDPWLEQTNVAPAVADAIVEALRTELDGGLATGLRPQLRDGALWFEQHFAAVTARAPS